MRIKNLVFYLVVFLAVATLSTAGSMAQDRPAEAESEKPQSFEGKVAEVVISGNRRTETSLIGLNIETKQGDDYSPQTVKEDLKSCLLYTSPSPRDRTRSRMPSSA